MPQIAAAVATFVATISSGGTVASATIAAVAAAGASIGTAVAVGNAVGAALAVFTGGSGIAAAVNAWSTVALLAATALRPPPVGRGAGGTQVDLQADPRSAIPLIVGRSATAGKIVHANTSGQANKNVALYYLLALTAGPMEGVDIAYANEFELVMGGAGGEVVIAPPQFDHAMLVNYTPGTKPDPIAHYPPGVEFAWIPEWTPEHRLSGVACAWWTLVYKPEKYPTGVPKPLFVVRGPPVYDPRLDSTYPGGSGPQRWNDEATWSYAGNDNPFLQGLTWCIGRHDNGVLTFGVGAPIDAIDVAAFVEGANVAEANDWRAGGEVLSTDRKWDVLRAILQAGGGEPMKLGGMLSCHVRAPRVILANLTGRDVVGDVSITGTKRRRDRFNQIVPTYRSEDHKWELVPAGPVVVDAYVAADGGVRSREGTYAFVQQPKQAAELAAYDILDAREFEPVMLPLGPRWAAFKPGDCIAVDEPEFGFIAQPLIVQTREIDPATGRVSLTCRSETAGKHDYALGRTPNPPPIPGFTPGDPTFVSRPDAGSWTATGGTLTATDGSTQPAIVVLGAITDPNVAEVIVEWRLQFVGGGFGEWSSSYNPYTVRRVEIRALIAFATYNVRVRYKSVRGVEGTLVLDLGLVVTGGLTSGGVTQIGGMTPGEIVEEIGKIEDLQNEWVMAVGSTPNPDGSRNVAGIKLMANPDVSSIAFLADEIGFTNGIDPGVFPLAVTGGRVIATNFQADDIHVDRIYAKHIISNEIAIPTVLSSAPNIPLGPSGNDRAGQFSAMHHGRPVDVAVYTTSNFTEQSGVAYTLKAYDGASNLLMTFPTFVANSGNRSALWPFISASWFGRWTPPAIGVVYILYGVNGGGALLTCTGVYILLTEQRTQTTIPAARDTSPLPPPDERRPIVMDAVRITGADGRVRYWAGEAEALDLNVLDGERFERLAAGEDIPQLGSVLDHLPEPPP